MQKVGRYRLSRRVASGGMAEVFEALATGEDGFERRVAIKRILPEFVGDASFARMFLDEARIASRLHHSNIVAVLDYGVADDAPFQVLEYVDGVDGQMLSKIGANAGAALPPEIALFLCAQVGHALEHAHTAVDNDARALGIVHRDVSPGNILVSWDGDVKLTDFGIALARDRGERTSAGVAKGKLAYMSPEQALAGEVDLRTDIFALGCTLHALLVGRSPISGNDQMVALLAGRAPDLDAGLPEDIRAIVARATRPSKLDRYESAAAMAKALGDAAALRLARDARTALREWLARVRPPMPSAPTPSAGRFDALINLDLVLAGDRESGRAFVTRAREMPQTRADEPASAVIADERTATPRPLAVAPPMVNVEPGAPESSDAKPSRSRVGRSIAALLVTSIVAATVALLPLVNPHPPADASGLTASRAAVPPSATEPVAREIAVAAEIASAPSEPRARAPGALNAHPAAPPRRGVSSPGPIAPPAVATATTSATPAPEPPPSDARGVLIVGGEGATHAEIVVDGRPAGFAPRTLDLPAGTHDIVLEDAEHHRIATTRLQLSARHTRSAPLRWIVPRS